MIIKSSLTRSKDVADLWEIKRYLLFLLFNLCHLDLYYRIILIQSDLIVADSKSDDCFSCVPFSDSESFGTFAVIDLTYSRKLFMTRLLLRSALLKCFLTRLCDQLMVFDCQ